MSLNFITTTKPEDVASFVARAIIHELQFGKRVLFFVTGGSSISVGVKVSKILREDKNIDQKLIQNLTVMLTDERYGPDGHPDSNWQQLLQKGFSLPGAKLIPTLSGDNIEITTKKFNQNLARELSVAKENKYKIGLFGIGKDGHTAGILPESVAVNSMELASAYTTATFSRITMTPKAIINLDQAVVFTQGGEKWPVLEDLNKEIDINKQPAQILKKVPILTIFTDYQKK
jgi:6-phosphogluconolactonase/glucosamine-6-phosphate isomerase/deaminase